MVVFFVITVHRDRREITVACGCANYNLICHHGPSVIKIFSKWCFLFFVITVHRDCRKLVECACATVSYGVDKVVSTNLSAIKLCSLLLT